MDPKQFFSKYSPYALKIEKETGVPAQLVLAQAALESNFGESGLSKNDYNFFGMKGIGTKGSGNYMTTEVINGKSVRVPQDFRRYNNPEESFRDHANLIKSNPRYARVMQVSQTGDPKQIAQEIGRSGYATDPQYGNKVYALITKHSLDKVSPNQGDTQTFARANTPTNPVISFLSKANPVNPPLVQAKSLPEDDPNQYRSMPPMSSKPVTQPIASIPSQTQPNQPETAFSYTPGQGFYPTNNPPKDTSYTVKLGDTLWGISQQTTGNGANWKQIQGYSGDPRKLQVGTVLKIPTPNRAGRS